MEPQSSETRAGRGPGARQAAPSLRRARPPSASSCAGRPGSLSPSRHSRHFANSSPARGDRGSAPCPPRRVRGAAGGGAGSRRRGRRRGRTPAGAGAEAGPQQLRAAAPPGPSPAPRRAEPPCLPRSHGRPAAANPPPARLRRGRGRRAGTMASAAEPPGKAAEYLQELTRIVAAQQELLARRRRRIEELERQVARLSRENAGLLERHRRHLAACARRPDPGPVPAPGPGPCPQPLGAIPELGGRRDK